MATAVMPNQLLHDEIGETAGVGGGSAQVYTNRGRATKAVFELCDGHSPWEERDVESFRKKKTDAVMARKPEEP